MGCNCGQRSRATFSSSNLTNVPKQKVNITAANCQVKVTNGQIVYNNSTYREQDTFTMPCDTAKLIPNLEIVGEA